MTSAAMADATHVAEPPIRTTGYAWYVAGMLSVGYLLSIMDRYLLSVVLDDVKAALLLSDTQLGVLQGPSFVILFLLASLPLGRMADVTNRRLLCAAGLMIWSLSTAACGLAETFPQLLMARLGVGLGEAALLPCAMSLISSYFSRDKISRGISIYSMGGSFGRAIAFGGGGVLVTWFAKNGGLTLPGMTVFAPWQAVFLVAGLIGVVVALIFLITVREPGRVRRAGRPSSLKGGLVHFLEHRWAYLAVFMPFSMTSAIASLLAAWSVSFYTRVHGLPVAQSSALIGMTGLMFGPIGHIFGGYINDVLRKRGMRGPQPMVLGIGLLGGTILVSLFALSASLYLAAAAYGVAYFMLCAMGPTGFGGVQLPTPEQHRGFLSSLFLVFYTALGTGCGPLVVGLLMDNYLHDPALLDQAVCLSAMFFALIGLPFALFGRGAYRRAVAAIEAEDAA